MKAAASKRHWAIRASAAAGSGVASRGARAARWSVGLAELEERTAEESWSMSRVARLE